MSGNAGIRIALARLAPELVAGATGIAALTLLSGGASQESWAFTVQAPAAPARFILRRAPGGDFQHAMTLGPELEAATVRAAGAAGVRVAPVCRVLSPADGLGRGFISGFVEGETIPRRLLRDPAFAGIRPHLAEELGRAAASIHAVPLASLPALPVSGARETLAILRRELDACAPPSPVGEFAHSWLAMHAPPEVPPVLVHGDFRNGNLIVGPDGLRAVLDWELAHLGDPAEDLGWFCAMPWRFGEVAAEAGGFGTRESFIGAHAAASGVPVEAARVFWWEVLASLRWGLICRGAVPLFAGGQDRSVERAMIARRASESDIDLLRLVGRAA